VQKAEKAKKVPLFRPLRIAPLRLDAFVPKAIALAKDCLLFQESEQKKGHHPPTVVVLFALRPTTVLSPARSQSLLPQ